MREIKFRAWDEENQCIVDGFTLNSKGTIDRNWYTNLMQYTGLKDKNGKEVFEGDIIEYFDWCNACEVVSTGGKIQKEFIDAYKNKYINRWNPLKGVVKWNEYHATYEPLTGEYDGESFASVCRDNTFKDYPDSYFEVIGNIYENPELI